MGDAHSELAGELMRWAATELTGAGIPSPFDEARLLMMEALEASDAWVLAHPEAEVPFDRANWYRDAVARRLTHEPFAYIAGHKEFYALDLQVTPDVLIPRPETELLVEKALALSDVLLKGKGRDLVVVDLGTGSGALAIALASCRPNLRLLATDSSPTALLVAQANATRHCLFDRIEFRHGDLLQNVDERIDLLVANLPYIPSGEIDGLMPDVRDYEPRGALDGGPDGTIPIRKALEQAQGKVDRPCALLFEIGDGQGEALSRAAAALYPDGLIRVDRDYAGFERILVVELQ
jgi:release factor glutamine methyltransferase